MGRFVLGRNEVPVLLNWLGSIAVRTLKLVKTLLTGVGADLNLTYPTDPILTRGWTPTVVVGCG